MSFRLSVCLLTGPWCIKLVRCNLCFKCFLRNSVLSPHSNTTIAFTTGNRKEETVHEITYQDITAALSPEPTTFPLALSQFLFPVLFHTPTFPFAFLDTMVLLGLLHGLMSFALNLSGPHIMSNPAVTKPPFGYIKYI